MRFRFKPTLSWKQRTIGGGLAVVASGAALFAGIIPASCCAPSPGRDAIATNNEQQRLQAMLDEAGRPGVDFRLRLEQRVRTRAAESARTEPRALAADENEYAKDH